MREGPLRPETPKEGPLEARLSGQLRGKEYGRRRKNAISNRRKNPLRASDVGVAQLVESSPGAADPSFNPAAPPTVTMIIQSAGGLALRPPAKL